MHHIACGVPLPVDFEPSRSRVRTPLVDHFDTSFPDGKQLVDYQLISVGGWIAHTLPLVRPHSLRTSLQLPNAASDLQLLHDTRHVALHVFIALIRQFAFPRSLLFLVAYAARDAGVRMLLARHQAFDTLTANRGSLRAKKPMISSILKLFVRKMSAKCQLNVRSIKI